MADFAIIALPGAYHSSVGALTDSFQLARDRIEDVFAGLDSIRMETALRVYSLDGAPVPLSDGTMLPVTGALPPDGPFTFIWLPSFRIGSLAKLEERLARSQPLLKWLRRQSETGAIIGASGAAATVLMAAGLTSGIAVPTARALQPVVRARFPRQRLDDRLGIVDDGALLIANGLGNDLPLIVRVVERTLSADVARWLTSIMGLDREEEHLLAADQLVARAQLWLEQHFTGPMRMSDLADALSTSLATVNRHFQKALGMSPRRYIQQLRLQAAIRMLEKSGRPVDKIAEQIGYSDSRLFRTMFREQTGMTATQWRARVRAGQKPG